jgi:hypothetical protein
MRARPGALTVVKPALGPREHPSARDRAAFGLIAVKVVCGRDFYAYC